MGLTVNVNKMTACHAGSNGKSISFPDVCKTPTPGGPIPIPYPNIAQSSDTADGSTKVKFDGSSIMLKGSNFKMSSGDEAGSAMGVVSSKIKGKAEFVNYSFDVKVEGKNVCRLADPMQQNMGSANAFGPALLQAPLVVPPGRMESCEKTKETTESSENKATSWSASGVLEKHQPKIQKVVDKLKIVIYFRATNVKCKKWINKKHRPKPHAVIDAKTISGDNEENALRWLVRIGTARQEGRIKKFKLDEKAAYALMWSIFRGRKPLASIHGIVMVRKDGDPNDGMPMLALKRHGGIKGADTGLSYRGKWITGDYDLMDVMNYGDNCERPTQTKASFRQIRYELNQGMKWDGIQHGPQAQWVAKSKEEGGHDFSSFSIPQLLVAWLNSPSPDPPKVQIAASRSMPACDSNLTAVFPGGTVHLKTTQDVKDALICCGCQNPKEEKKDKYKPSS